MAGLRRLIRGLQRWFRRPDAPASAPVFDGSRTPLEVYLLSDADPSAGLRRPH